KCEEDKNLKYELQVDYGKINPENHRYIFEAIQRAKLEELLKKYTNKPVKMHFQLESNGSLALNLSIRFDRERYMGWTKNRIPATMHGYHILSLDPYYAIMQTLVFLRYALPAEAPKPLRQSFLGMETSLTLDTILSGS